MDKFTPDELRDLPNMKRRVMQNVVEHVTSKQKKRSFNMKYTVLTVAFTLGIGLFVGYEVFINKDTPPLKVVDHDTNELDQDPAEKTIVTIVQDELAVEYWKRGTTANTDIDNKTNANPDTDYIGNPDDTEENDGEASSGITLRDFTRPKITVSNNKFYIEGVTLGDTVEKVTSILGNNYTTGREDTSGELMIYDNVMIYDNIAQFIFEKNKLIQVMLIDVNKEYYDKFYNASQLIKIDMGDEMNLLYIKNTEEIIKSAVNPNNKRILYYMMPGPEFYHYYPEYKH